MPPKPMLNLATADSNRTSISVNMSSDLVGVNMSTDLTVRAPSRATGRGRTATDPQL